MSKKDINKAIEIIEQNTVYRNTNLTDKAGFFIAVNDPKGEVWEWSYKKIMYLAKIVKNKPRGLK